MADSSSIDLEAMDKPRSYEKVIKVHPDDIALSRQEQRGISTTLKLYSQEKGSVAKKIIDWYEEPRILSNKDNMIVQRTRLPSSSSSSSCVLDDSQDRPIPEPAGINHIACSTSPPKASACGSRPTRGRSDLNSYFCACGTVSCIYKGTETTDVFRLCDGKVCNARMGTKCNQYICANCRK